MQKEILLNGPIQCSTRVPDGMNEEYKNGIINDKTYPGWCKNGVHGHSVNIIGWGHTEKDDYWIVRTSWGRSFGEQGFFRIERGINCFNIENDCTWAIPKRFPNSPIK